MRNTDYQKIIYATEHLQMFNPDIDINIKLFD